jgi:hypothetical protein
VAGGFSGSSPCRVDRDGAFGRSDSRLRPANGEQADNDHIGAGQSASEKMGAAQIQSTIQ